MEKLTDKINLKKIIKQACVATHQDAEISPTEREIFQCENVSSNIRKMREGREVRNLRKLPSLKFVNSALKEERASLTNFSLPQGRQSGKAAFTLAEVLITLGIIGIVAAMTLPTLIQNYQKKVIQNQLKKNYAILQNWVKQAETREELPMSNWPTGTAMNLNDFWDIYIQPYFSQVKKCSNMKDCGYKGNYASSSNEAKQWTGANWALVTEDTRVLFRLGDGTVVFLPRNTGNAYVSWFYVDVNGTAGPNTNCKDVFIFQRGTIKGIEPIGCTLELFKNNWEFTKNYAYW